MPANYDGDDFIAGEVRSSDLEKFRAYIRQVERQGETGRSHIYGTLGSINARLDRQRDGINRNFNRTRSWLIILVINSAVLWGAVAYLLLSRS